MTENELRKKVVSQAVSWYGCKESDGSHKKIIDTYNKITPLPRGYKMQYTDEWCAAFVSAVGSVCGLSDIIPAECSCNQMIAKHKALGTWMENDGYTPKAGDLIMYDWDDSENGDNTGVADHVGIVTAVSGGTITVIEGNKGTGYVGYRYIKVNGKHIRGFCTPAYSKKATGAEDSNTSQESNTDTSVDVTYRVRAGGKWYSAVKNLSDFAGKVGLEITDFALKVSAGSVKYRVHVKGGSWLPWVTGYDINDMENGYAGNGKVIDAIQVYYYTPDSIRPYKRAKYRVSPVKDDYYSWQYDTETSGAQDGYAGSFGDSIDRFQVVIE